MKQNSDLVGILIASVMSILIIVLPLPIAILQAGAALLLVFILPGYALRCLLFTNIHLDIVESLTYTVGLSLTLTIIGAFLLHYSPWGLQTLSWLMLLGGVTIASAGIAMTRRVLMTNIDVYRSYRPDINREQFLLVCLALLMVVAAYWNSYASASNQPYDEFTQFWMVDAGQNMVQIGIKNVERQAQDYVVVLKANNQPIYQSEIINLSPQDDWGVRLRYDDIRNLDRITASLYLSDQMATPYREVWLYADE